MLIYLANKRYLSDIPVERVSEFETDFYKYMDVEHPEIGLTIKQSGQLSDETKEKLDAAIEAFKKSFI